MTEESTIGGIAIKPWLSQPRSLDDEGKPRYDVFNVILAEKIEADAIKTGEIYPLLIDFDPPKSTEAEQGGGHRRLPRRQFRS